ncbi:sensor histidine kinase [Paracoccus tibetensis]|uniref:histidine kinase n=1 Tax=Paracoccus tibetensis TaxID=336292 RepID=A0A1G5EFK1_9RHOB|nr:sensor histidine kinase [Paracoccus tibetensis]SCY25727.1 Two-component sensor histidine kinase, contains HisKA and HATPase domains [Paracoccus tibetensis]
MDFTRRLGFRLIALLSVAILPIGLISLVQNLHLSREAERSAEIALLGRTASAASGERALLQSALGSADALGPAILENLDRPEACSDLLRNFVERSATYVAAGFVPLNGLADCTSGEGGTVDMRGFDAFKTFLASPTTQVLSMSQGPLSGRAVVVVMQPLYRDRELLGYTGVSLTQELLRSTHSLSFGTEGARILTFNHLGEVLTADSQLGLEGTDLLPQGVALADLAAQTETTFRAMANNDERRVFSVVSVVPGLVYALGSWNPRAIGIGGFQLSRFGAIILPVALWAVSLAVAYLAVFRLVLRHIGVLRGQMRRFAIGNRDTAPPVLEGAPTEIMDVSQTFHNMARILIRDEEAMEQAVAEKTVLLKEVHHRVKNNLQLIASIINMQSRLIDDKDAKRVLRSIQDRVAALATIYRALYQAEQLDSVEVDHLLTEIVSQLSSVSTSPDRPLRIETDLVPITMLPDQAVPLTLLATEAFTNAVKYADTSSATEPPLVRVRLCVTEPGRARLVIDNTVAQEPRPGATRGLGTQLIEAFAMQLDGRVHEETVQGMHRLSVDFEMMHNAGAHGAEGRKVVLTSAARAGARH